jgi:UbiD family decarboxylase
VPKSLRSFIEQIGHEHPDELAVVRRTVDPGNYDVTAILEQLTQQQRFPMLLCESALDLQGRPSGVRVASNVFATRERIADAIGQWSTPVSSASRSRGAGFLPKRPLSKRSSGAAKTST